MSDPETPEDPKKKLDLNKETIKELDESELDQVAGGALGTGGARCKSLSYPPACPQPIQTEGCAPTDACTVGCSPEPDPATIVNVNCPAPFEE